MSRSAGVAIQYLLLALCWLGVLIALPGLAIAGAANRISLALER